jgi:class 3 adenylate cyclase
MEDLMTYISSRVERSVKDLIEEHISVEEWSGKVPETSDITLEKNEGIEIDAAYLYADLVDSSGLAQRAYRPVTAKIIRAYINSASKLINHYGGEIRSFDGDRVMAIYVGDDKETDAVRTALAINWAAEVIKERMQEYWEGKLNFWMFKHCIGVDTGKALMTRAGARGDSDLVSIGSAPNVAAKLSDLRSYYPLHITKEVYEPMSNDVAFDEQQQMWHHLPPITVGARTVRILGSSYQWAPA